MSNYKYKNVKYLDITGLDFIIYRVYLSDLKIYKCIGEYSEVINNTCVNGKLIGFSLVKNKQEIINVYKYLLSHFEDDMKYLVNVI